MVSLNKFILLCLSLSTTFVRCGDPDIVEGTDENLPVKDNPLYIPLIGEDETSGNKGARGFFEDLPQLEKRVPAKKLAKPRNVTSASIEKLISSYKYSALSVCLREWIVNGNCICSKTFKYHTILEDTSADIYAVSGVDPAIKSVIISYRGTKSFKNWQTNFDYEQIQLPGAKEGVLVHRGFYKAHLTIQAKAEQSILSLLKNPAYKGYKLHVTGISLGGALATISSVSWKNFLVKNNLNSPMEVFAFSSPRVGNEGFAQFLADSKYPITRYTNMNDIVPHFWPRSYNYVHVAAEIFERRAGFGRTELIYCDQSYDEDPKCGLSEQGPYSLARHVFVLNKLPTLPFC